MTGRIGRPIGLAVGAVLIFSAACSGHPAAGPTTKTPSTSSAEPVTPSGVTPVTSSPSVATSTSASPTAASLTHSSAGTTLSPSHSVPGSTTPVPPDQRFPWTIDYKLVPKTAPVQAVIKAAMPVYQAYMATYDQSLQAPNSRNWESVMKAYATDKGLSVWQKAWEGTAKLGVVQKGDTSAVGRIIGVGTNVVSMRACIDVSQVKVVDQAGNVLPLAKGIPIRGFAWLLTIEQGSDGRMRVVELLTQTPSGKTFSC